MADLTLESTEEIIQLVSVSGASQGDITSAVATHNADTTAVHGIADTAQIGLKNAANVWTLGQTFQSGIVVGTAASDQQISIFSGPAPTFRFIPNSENVFFTHLDPTFAISWNHADAPDYVTDKHTWGMHWESDFYPSAIAHQCEWYLSYNRATTHENQRPIAVSMSLDTHTAAVEFQAGTVGFTKSDGTDTLLSMNATNGIVEVSTGKAFYLIGTAALGIGVSPTAGGTPLLIQRDSDMEFVGLNRSASFRLYMSLNDTTDEAIIGVAGATHKMRLDTNGSQRIVIDQDGLIQIDYPSILYLNSNPLRVGAAGLYGDLADVVRMHYPGYPTFYNAIRTSTVAATGVDSRNMIELSVCTAANTVAQCLTVKGDRRVHISTPNTAVTDGDIPAGNITAYLDESGNNLLFRVKYANGTTLKTGTVALA